jgi:hypothetical protein
LVPGTQNSAYLQQIVLKMIQKGKKLNEFHKVSAKLQNQGVTDDRPRAEELLEPNGY